MEPSSANDGGISFQVPVGRGDTRQDRVRRKFVLCFDGTGNKLNGDAGDSNVLKIYSMLERSDQTQYHYYQPGIGTYTNSKSLSHTSMSARLSSWVSKAKDQAIGNTLDEHVMAGYKFLMRYYQDGDDIYFFGFSRGSYIARFLAEMLDHVGLLSAGNEELVRFVWKTFAKWQQRGGGSAAQEKKKEETLKYMKAFRETFSRPVRRIRFLGLFDTVNSVARFETAWMQRSGRFPYSARSSAIMIRHAVSIDERRAKFRQDLISQVREKSTSRPRHEHSAMHTYRQKKPAPAGQRRATLAPADAELIKGHNNTSDRFRSTSRGRSIRKSTVNSARTNSSADSSLADRESDDSSDDEDIPQDIDEIWFPGQHGDIGGGWYPNPPEELTLAHAPLVWMVREAERAGLTFDIDKKRKLKCYIEEEHTFKQQSSVPEIKVNGEQGDVDGAVEDAESEDKAAAEFLATLESSCVKSQLHDSLAIGGGMGTAAVLAWQIMEYLPFRRMDLQSDGSWKPIRWPLPMGEVRDIPENVKVHNSVIKRMKADPKYRPGNLIVGGGGRGTRFAPTEAGMGEWEILRGAGHPVDEVWVKKSKVKDENPPTTAPQQKG